MGGTADGLHRHGAEHEHQHRAKEHPDKHLGIHEVHVVEGHEVTHRGILDQDSLGVGEDVLVDRLVRILGHPQQTYPQLLDVSAQKGHGRKGCGTDRVSLSGSCGGVAQRIESVSPFPDLGIHVAHLGVSTRVVRYRTISVGGKRDSQGRKHSDRADSDPIQAHRGIRESVREPVGQQDRDADGNHRDPGGDHSGSQPRDDDRGGTRGGLFGYIPGGLVVG